MELTTTDIIIRVALAVLFGSILGLERTLAGKTAGMRTYAMVALGSSTFVLIAEMVASAISSQSVNIMYMPGAVITGIGFIGAGLVLFQPVHTKFTGLTTAAGLWVAAALGIASGFGLFQLAAISTVAALVIFTILWFIEKWIMKFSYDKDKENEESR